MTTTAVKERPILFSAPMIRAILDGRKTQTRRIIKPQPRWDDPVWWLDDKPFISDEAMADHLFHEVYGTKGTPYGSLYEGGGDRMWVRETWAIKSHKSQSAFNRDPDVCRYRADGDDPLERWSPSIHMPRWASRLTLEITDVRVQRVQDISAADAFAEGCNKFSVPKTGQYPIIADFIDLWNSINGPGAWARNDFVWVIGFRRLEQA